MLVSACVWCVMGEQGVLCCVVLCGRAMAATEGLLLSGDVGLGQVACSQALLTLHAHHLQLQLEIKARRVRPDRMFVNSRLCDPMEHFLDFTRATSAYADSFQVVSLQHAPCIGTGTKAAGADACE